MLRDRLFQLILIGLIATAPPLSALAQEEPAPVIAAQEDPEKAEPEAQPKADEPTKAQAEPSTPDKAETPAKSDAPEKSDAPVKSEEPAKTDPPVKTETPAKVEAPVKPPVVQVTQTAARKDERNIRFQFDNIPYTDVVKRFAQMSGKAMIGDYKVDGTLTFMDAEPYTYGEALDVLNNMLAGKGWYLKEDGRYLRMVQVNDLATWTRIFPGLEEAITAGSRSGEVVTVMLPVAHIDVETASKAIVPMVSVFGRISPLVRGKGILLTDTLSNIERIRRLLALMDAKSEEEMKLDLKNYMLKRATAANAASVINNLLRSRSASSSSRDPREGSGTTTTFRAGDSVIYATADERSNILLLRGTKDMLELADQLVLILEAENPDAVDPIRTFGLKTAGARDVSAAIQAIIGRDRGVYVYGDTSMNSVLVRAGAEDMRIIEKLIKDLDASVKDLNTVKAFPLKYTTATAIAEVLRTVLAPRDIRGERTFGNIAVSADPSTNTIYVSGPAAVVENATKIIADIDKYDGESRQLHVITNLGQSSATEMATQISQMYEKQYGNKASPQIMPTIQAIASSNTLLVSCLESQWEQVKSVIDTIKDVAIPTNVAESRILALKHAKASELAETVKTVYSAPRRTTTASRGSSGSAEMPPVIVTASDRNNSLVVSAAADDQAAIAKLVTQLDVPAAENVDPVRIIQLSEAADVSAIAQTLIGMIPPAIVKEGKVYVQADTASRSIIFRAPESERKLMEELIAKLDELAPQNARETRMLPLDKASASSLAPMLVKLYETVPAAGARTIDPAERVVIAAAPGDKLLIIDAPRKKIEEIAGLIKSMDQENSSVAQEMRTYSLEKASAQGLVQALSAMFQPSANSKDSAELQPRISAEGTTLIVLATLEQHAKIEKVIKDVEATRVVGSTTKRFRLANSSATDVAAALEAILVDKPVPGVTAKDVPQTRVVAVDITNDIIVQGPMDKITLAEILIKDFDDPDAQKTIIIQQVQLKNAQAGSMAEVVTAVFAAQVKNAGPAGKAVSDDAVTVSADPNSNSVLVRGPFERVMEAVKMIERLDSESTANSSKIQMYQLKNGDAAALAKTLDDIFKAMIAAASKGKNVTPPPFTVGADPRTNKLVVSTTPTYFALVEQIIESLDNPQERVNREAQYFFLKNAWATDVASQIEATFADRKTDKPVILADTFAESISVIASPEDMKTIEELVTKLDEGAKTPEDNRRIVEVINMKQQSAAKIAAMLQTLYSQKTGGKVIVTDKLPDSAIPKPESENVPAPAPKDGPPAQPKDTKPSARADDSSNSPMDVEALVRNVADDVIDGIEPSTEFIAAAADPDIKKIEVPEPASGPIPDVIIAVDEPTNTLIISGTRKQLAEIDSLISQFSTSEEASDGFDFRVFSVKHSDPETLAQVLNSLFNAKFLTQQQQLQGGNAQQQQLFQMMQQQLMQQMGGAAGGGRGGDSGTDPVTAAMERSGVLQRGGGNSNAQGGTQRNARAGGQQQAAAPTVIIVADKRTNRIIARGKPTDLDLVSKVIDQIDTSTTVASVVRVFPLKNTDAREVATNITAMFAGSAGARGTTAPRSVMIRGKVEEAIKGQLGKEPVDMASIVSVTSNQQTNSVIATAPAEAMDIIAEMIQEIDQSAALAAVPTVQMYPIKNADLGTTVNNLQKIYGPLVGTGNGPNASGRVTITADAASNTIIVAASADQQAMIAKVIADIDNSQPAGELEIKVYKIANAEATSVASTLADMLMPGSSGTRQNANSLQWLAGPRSGGAPAPTADVAPGAMRISADASSNSLVIRATKEMHEKIAELIAKIDVPVIATQPLQLVSLQHADPVSLAQLLTKIFTQQSSITVGNNQFRGQNNQRQPIVIEGDRESKKLIVRSDEETFKKIQEMAMQLDVASPLGKLSQRLIQIKAGRADSIAKALTDAFATNSRTVANLATGGQAEDPSQRVTVIAEVESNTIIVTASEENHKKIDALLPSLDVDVRGEMVNRFLVLQNASAQDLSRALSSIASARGTSGGGNRNLTGGRSNDTVITSENASNIVIFSGPEKDVEKYLKLAEAMDVEKADTETGITVIPIRNGDAVDMANTINNLFRLTAINSGSLLKSGGPASPKFAVSADMRSNSLIVVADQMTRTQIQFTVNHLESIAPQRGQPRILTLKYADPTDVQRAINSIYGGQDTTQQQNQGNRGGNQGFNQGNQGFQPTNQGNRGGGNQNFNQGTQPNQGGQQNPNVTPTQNPRGGNQPNRGGNQNGGGAQPNRGGNAPNGGQRSDLNPAGSSMTTRSTADGRVSATPVPNSGSIIVNSSDEDYEAIQRLVEMMEEAAKGQQRQTKVIILERANNQRIAQALAQMYGNVQRPEDRVGVTSLAGTNAIVIAAVESKLPEVEALIKMLDDKNVVPQVEFRIFTLKNSTPSKMVPLVQRMLAKVDVIRQDDSFDVQADDRTRSLIVTAKTNVFDQVGKVIDLLDQAPAHEAAEIMIVQLKRADSTRMAAVLNEMLRQRSGTTTITPEGQALQEQVRLLKIMDAKGEKMIELDLYKPMKIIADPINAGEQGANALVISGTPDNLQALSAIIAMMDAVPLTEDVKVNLVHLKKADAQSVATILTEIFTQGQKLAGKAGTSTAGKAEPEEPTGKAIVNPLNVSADLRTNSLVLSGKPETLELAVRIATDLDRETGKFVTEVRLFQLGHAKASVIAPILSEVFTETAVQGGGNNANTQAVAGIRAQATQLWMKVNEKDVQSEFTASRPALTVRGDDVSQTLVVAARSDVMPIIADVIKSLDVPGAGAGNLVRFIPLENADATRIKTMIDSLYTGQNAKDVRETDIPTVGVDTRTNTLVIAASEKTFIMITAMTKQVDKKLPIELKEIKLVKLQNAEASALAPTLQTAMDQRVQQQQTLGAADAEALRMLIVADPRSNSLIVAGSTEGFKLVESLAQQLDNAGPALATQIQIMGPLKEANAGTLSTTLTQLFNERYAAATTPDVQKQKPTILADLRTNSLLVAANADDSKVLTGLLAKMDVKQVNPAVDLFVVGLTHNDAATVGPSLTRLFQARLQATTLQGAQPSPQDQVTIETDALSNALIISASKENMALIQNLLTKVDVDPPAQTGVVRMYHLVNADASRISQILQDLVTQGLYKPGTAAATGQNQVVANREKIAVQVDTRTNVLIVSASKENFAVIEEIVKQLDSSKDYGVLGDMRMFALKHADATRLGPTLQEIFDKKRAAEQAVTGTAPRALAVSIIAEARTNTLLVGGSTESFTAVEAMIKELDGEQVPAAGQFKVFELKYATASALQPMLQDLFANMKIRDTTKDAVTVLADSRSQSLIVGATAEHMALAESLIKQLDIAKVSDTVERIYPLRKADATQVLTTLKELYDAQSAANGTTPSGVVMSAQARINSIIVRAGTADHERIASLIGKLDSNNVQRITEIKVVVLKQADATELAAILNDILTKKAIDPNITGTDSRQTILQFLGKTESGKQFIAQALQEGVMISAERRSNSLIISAPLDYMPLLQSLIQSLDQTPAKPAEIRRFLLKNADATQMSDIITKVFKMDVTDAAGTKMITYRLVGGRPVADANGNFAPIPEATVGTAEQDALRVTIDTRTNSLLVGGTPEHVQLVSRIVDELDDSPALERKTEVFRLRNGQALDIETTLRNFLDQERTRLTSTLGTDKVGAAQRLAEQDVSIVAEPTSNSLLVSASPRYYAQIKAMIDKLDDPKPQVLIQVLLAEVTLDDSIDLGFDFQITKGIQSHNVQGGTNFGVQQAIQQFGGMGVSVTGGDFSFFLRALQAQGKLEVLSRPQILASDNQPANITVGQRVPFVTNSSISDTGNVVNTIQYEDVGILLNVTARISDDGFVNMDVNPEISSLSNSSVQVSETVSAPIISNRSAATRVTVQDGQTIVVGGLITTTDEERVSKVPILGDIPLIKYAFQSTTHTKQRTELLIILTPRILYKPSDAAEITRLNRERMELIRKIKIEEAGKGTEIPFDGAGPLREFENKDGKSPALPNGAKRGGDFDAGKSGLGALNVGAPVGAAKGDVSRAFRPQLETAR